MSKYDFKDEELRGLSGKVVLVTGGAKGIGKAIVEQAYHNGAKVAFCDTDVSAGQKLSDEYKGTLFQKCDVSVWEDVLGFFKAAFDRFGVIDAVISNAAINSVAFATSEIDIASGNLAAPNMAVVDVNLTGTWYVSVCAIHYFKHHRKDATSKAQLVLFGSIASYIDTPPVFQYCASKAAVLGMLRGLRTQLPRDNISINMIAPWMTFTDLVPDAVRSRWGDLPVNTPDQVARAGLMPVVRPDLNGLAFIISGGNITEVEAKLDETQHLWLGAELDEHIREGQRRLLA